MTACVVATAGHVDHGKSTLVSAITGIDPDRFEEEKQRGLTIDLGFAWASLPSGRDIAFVDVPGHVRFLKNMLAGVGALDACLFVVAATEGWKAQSEEHLRILELLGFSRGVVALTKVASLEQESRELARLALGEQLHGSFLASAPVVDVDVPGGLGLDRLVAALDVLTASMQDAPPAGGPADERPRLWIDRSFPIRGSGTVVTGTLTGGSIAINDRLELVPGSLPDGRPRAVRVRGLQSQRRPREQVGPGRVAVNLSGLSHDQIERGQGLVRPGQWEPTKMLDASLTVLATLGHDVRRRGAYRAYFGSGQHEVRIRLLHAEAIKPGETGAIRVHLEALLPLVPGDRYVLREAGRAETVGGGEVLDVAPLLPAVYACPDRSVDRVVREHRIVDVHLLARLTGVRREPNLGSKWVTDPRAIEDDRERLRRSVMSAGPFGLDVALLAPIDRAIVSELTDVVISDGRARIDTGEREVLLSQHRYVRVIESSPFRPPSPDEMAVDRAELRELVRSGTVIESGGCFFSPKAVTAAAREIARLLEEQPGGIAVSAIRDALDTSRKYLLPLLAHLDATGVTRRRGDLRVGGPKLPGKNTSTPSAKECQ
ncbi:MAG: selenocysteine-specific translation elongation factor [Acidimicrobiales bacterium]